MYCHGDGSGGAHQYTKYHGHMIHNILYDPLPEAICVAMATCNLVGKMLLISMSILQTCNYDQSLVVTDTNTPTKFQVLILLHF